MSLTIIGVTCDVDHWGDKCVAKFFYVNIILMCTEIKRGKLKNGERAEERGVCKLMTCSKYSFPFFKLTPS
jgi:hypothetical protein